MKRLISAAVAGLIFTAPAEMSPQSMTAAADYSANAGGTAVVVMQNGAVIFERYEKDFTADSPFHAHSGTKGFWGPVIAAMIEDGLIDSFDEPAAVTLTEWTTHPAKSKITVRQLMELNAGLAQDLESLQGHDRKTLAPDLYSYAVNLSMMHAPGQRFAYGPSCYYVLGEIMKRKLAPQKLSPLDYLRQRILDRLGIKTGGWVHDASGNPHIPNGAWITAREWAVFGQWMLQNGEWNGEQIVNAELIQELRRPSAPNPGHRLAI
ncbi:MAG: serine hydrolase [Kiritimatiellales bacterium]